MADSPYPRLLYRPGTECLGIWGAYDCDLRIVADEQEEASALGEGWALRPDDERLTFDETPPVKNRGGRPRKIVMEPVDGD